MINVLVATLFTLPPLAYATPVSYTHLNIVAVPLSEVAGKLKYVPKDSNIIQSARDVGICFGD